MYAIPKPTHFQPSIYSDGDVVPILLLKALSQVDEIFLIDELFEPVIALSSDFRDHPEHSFIFNALDFPGDNPGRVEQFLRENNVSFQLISASFPKEVLSGDGNLIARDDGIYLVRTNQKIVSGISSVRVRGWLSNEHGVIYSSHVGGPCLLQLGLPFTDGPSCAIRVPQPVLLLKVPEEYLFSAPTP
jgi:hypothetical protein